MCKLPILLFLSFLLGACTSDNIEHKCTEHQNLYTLLDYARRDPFVEITNFHTVDSLLLKAGEGDTIKISEKVAIYYDSTGYNIQLPCFKQFYSLDSIYRKGEMAGSTNLTVDVVFHLQSIYRKTVGGENYYLINSIEMSNWKYSPSFTALIVESDKGLKIFSAINAIFGCWGDYDGDNRLDYLDICLPSEGALRDTFKLYTLSDEEQLIATKKFIVVTPSHELQQIMEQEPSPFDSIIYQTPNWCEI